MTMKMAALQPEEIIVNSKSSHEVDDEMPKCGPESPDGVDGLEDADHADECEPDEEESVGSESESEEEENDEQEEEEEQVEELDAAALLAFSKSRLEKQPQPAPVAEPTPPSPTETDEADDDEVSIDNENSEEKGGISDSGAAEEGKTQMVDSPAEEKKIEADSSAAVSPTQDKNNDNADEPDVVKDQSYYIELAMQKSKEAEIKAQKDEDPAYLMKLAEKKVEEANKKAKEDEEAFEAEEAAAGETVVKPALAARPTREENSELWALLNYSKRRLETGSTPQVAKRGSVKGDDNQSVSSKLSKASKRSLGSRKSITAPVTVVGGPGDLASPLAAPQKEGGEKSDAPFPDVTDNGDDSVEGSVSLENDSDNEAEEEEESDNSDDESSDEESEEEEDELPSFLKDADDAADAEEAKMLYEAAKFKAASILSVSEENLTDVQMLQAIAIAEEAARKGDEKFSTKRSLFKLNEARVEDLKSFLNLSMSSLGNNIPQAPIKQERQAVGWGIGRGRLAKKLGSVVQDFKEKCNEIDEKKQQERQSQPTTKEMMSAAMLDLKTQIDEYEKIVNSKKAATMGGK